MTPFITFEGPEGSGKTTQVAALATWLRSQGLRVITVREPGATAIGDQVREIVHNHDHSEMDSVTEFLLYSAARAQLVAQVIRPALASGQIVISDRYADSSLAYQGYGRGLPLEHLHAVTQVATGGLQPTVTFFLDLPVTEGLRRKQRSGEEWNRLDSESVAFHERVRAGYLALSVELAERWIVIDATRSLVDIQNEIRQRLSLVILHPS